MDRKLQQHEQIVISEISRLKKGLNSNDKTEQKEAIKETKELSKYHIERLRDFQHERLIHLLVTLFFALVIFLCVTDILLIQLSAIETSVIFNTITISAITTIFIITEIFYVRHYYKLENGTQRLYNLSEELFKMNYGNTN